MISILGLCAGVGLLACSDDAPTGPDGPSACASGQSFAAVDFPGIWHFEARFDELGVSTNVMLVTGAEDAYQVSVYGREASEVLLDESGMHVFVIASQGPDVATRTRQYDICTRDPDGVVHGSYVYCIDEDCYSATLTGAQVEPLDEPAAEGVSEIAIYNGEADAWAAQGLTVNVRVLRDMAYVARYGDGLRIVDISDPSQPVERGHLPVTDSGEIYNDVKVAEGPGGEVYALMASNLHGVVVVDVSEPSAPVELTSFPGPELAVGGMPSVHTLFVDNGRAYVSYNYDNSLRIYDIADPAQPQALGSFANPRLGAEGGTLHDLYVSGDRAYLNYWNLGMSIVDVADPANPLLLGEFRDYGQNTSHSNWVVEVGGRTISVHGDEQFGAHVRIVDVDPASPDFLSTLSSYQTRPAVSVHNILAYGDRAYITYYQDGLRVLDIGDPENPVEIAHYQTWPGPVPGYGESFYEGAIGVDFDPTTNTVYLADTHRGLFILDVP
jgi:hypothetical protein